MFNISITVSLTKKGFENYKEVILRILKYIKAIQNKKVNKRFYDEIKIVKEMRFNYADKLEPIYVFIPLGRTTSIKYTLLGYLGFKFSLIIIV